MPAGAAAGTGAGAPAAGSWGGLGMSGRVATGGIGEYLVRSSSKISPGMMLPLSSSFDSLSAGKQGGGGGVGVWGGVARSEA